MKEGERNGGGGRDEREVEINVFEKKKTAEERSVKMMKYYRKRRVTELGATIRSAFD